MPRLHYIWVTCDFLQLLIRIKNDTFDRYIEIEYTDIVSELSNLFVQDLGIGRNARLANNFLTVLLLP